MDFISEAIQTSFWEALANFASDLIKEMVSVIINFTVQLSDVNKYLNTNEYLMYVYGFAGGLLIISIAFQSMKYQSGLAERMSISEMTMRVIFSAAGIYVLPWSLNQLLIPINNILMNLINSIGQEVTVGNIAKFLFFNPGGTSVVSVIAIMSIVWVISLIIFGIAGAIRHVELIVATLMAPIMATTIVKGNEGVETWFKEAISLVFTQPIHMLLLKLLIKVCIDTTGLITVLLTIGIVTVAIKGPQVIRSYMYSSGVGRTSIGSVGGGVRMVSMTRMMKIANPVK